MTLEEIKNKYPYTTNAKYEPKYDCKFCNGTGINERDRPCICVYVQHDFCEEAAKMISDFAKRELKKI